MTSELNQHTVLQGDALQRLLSPYLIDGFQQDTHQVNQLDVRGRTAIARCCIGPYYTSPYDKKFHLSALNGMALVSQVCIAHAHALHGYQDKAGEVLMTDFSMSFSGMVREPEDIEVHTELVGKFGSKNNKRGDTRILHTWRYELGGSWWGNVSLYFYFPKAQTEPQAPTLSEHRGVPSDDRAPYLLA